MAQSTYKNVSINNRPPQLVDSAFFADIRFDPNDVTPIYIGLNKLNGAPTNSADWKIYKFTYSSGVVTRIQLAYGSWDGRVALF